jgi:hypothetical protein
MLFILFNILLFVHYHQKGSKVITVQILETLEHILQITQVNFCIYWSKEWKWPKAPNSIGLIQHSCSLLTTAFPQCTSFRAPLRERKFEQTRRPSVANRQAGRGKTSEGLGFRRIWFRAAELAHKPRWRTEDSALRLRRLRALNAGAGAEDRKSRRPKRRGRVTGANVRGEEDACLSFFLFLFLFIYLFRKVLFLILFRKVLGFESAIWYHGPCMCVLFRIWGTLGDVTVVS